jgi:retron-type reverse transcriptase
MITVAAKQKHIRELAKRDPHYRFPRLYRVLCTEAWLTAAWQRIRANKGSKTAGVDGQTKDDVDAALIARLAAKLRQEAYVPTPVRRVYIPKAKGKRRPLGISTIQDRIVQSALKMLLEPIFEPDFRPCSHGFRPGRSCMTALQEVARRFPRTTWSVEGDITSCYDAIPHGRLLSLIRRRVDDEKLLRLLYTFLRAGYLEQWHFHGTYSGVPQGNIVSPLLANCYLHELDRFMEEGLGANCKESKAERKTRWCKDRLRLDSQAARVRLLLQGKRGRGNKLLAAPLPAPEDQKRLREELRVLDRQRKQLPVLLPRRKVGYIRYGDDYLVLLQRHSKAEAEEIKGKIRAYLASHLHLEQSAEKTHITHPTNPVRFLGYELRSEGGRRKRLRLDIPKDAQATLLAKVGKLCRIYQIAEADLMLKVNAAVRGWMNYYRYGSLPQGVFNRVLHQVFWQVSHYLARKHHTSIAQIMRRHAVTIHRNGRRRKTLRVWSAGKPFILGLFPPQTESIYRVAMGHAEIDVVPRTVHEWAGGRSIEQRQQALEAVNYRCQGCGTPDALVVHHVGGLRGYHGRKNLVAAGEAKPKVVLCAECHLRLGHQGSFRPSPQGRKVT